MRLLIFLVLSRYGLACKYGIISQLWLYHWMENYIFWYFWHYIFIFEDQIQLKSYLNLLQQVRWFVTWCVESSIIILNRTSPGRQLQQKKKKIDQDRIWTHSTIMFIIFRDFRMVDQILFSPQVKENVIINNKLEYTSCLTSCRTT